MPSLMTKCEICGEKICTDCDGCGCDDNPCTCALLEEDDEEG
ncbi:MAG: hypothetical protein PHH13_01050 [Candidatus Peribacteraceae bacterium]|nr:hypothetical protein [Candidatus Peribacteraceae bacterium]